MQLRNPTVIYRKRNHSDYHEQLKEGWTKYRSLGSPDFTCMALGMGHRAIRPQHSLGHTSRARILVWVGCCFLLTV